MFVHLNLVLAFIFQFGGACGCEDKPQISTLAVVNGVKITKQELGSEVQNRITQLQAQVIKARGDELNLQINNLLLATEARKRGISPEQLLQLEVTDKVGDPDEEEVREYYKERRKHIGEKYKTARPSIIAVLKAEREQLEILRFFNALRAAANIQVLIPNVTPPGNEEELNRTFVVVNGTRITSRDIEESLLPLIFNVQQQVYALRKQGLDLNINDLLLDQEAHRRNVSPAILLAREVRSRLPIITDQQAKAYYNAHKTSLHESFDKVKMQIVRLLMSQEEQKLSNAFAAQLRGNAAVQIYLTPPESPTFKISTENQPTKGNQDAAVVVVEFTDFACAACAPTFSELNKLFDEFGAQVKFVVRDFPSTQDQTAMQAAEAAEAARAQGKYWEYIPLLYANQSALKIDDLKRYASRVGLDRAKFDVALETGQFHSLVLQDIREGTRLFIEKAPVIFVAGKRVSDLSYQGLQAEIQAALRRAPVSALRNSLRPY